DTWTDGNLAAGGVQWFRFTATATAQYIHFKPGALNFVYIQILTGGGIAAGNQASLNSSTMNTSQSLTIGQEYYIRVWTYSGGAGTYQIAFNARAVQPGEVFPPASVTALSADIWANGNLTAGGVQWFRFTATAATQYIHFKPGTLTEVYTQVYANDGTAVGSTAQLYNSSLYTSRTLTVGQEYYIRVWPYSGSGQFQIGLNAWAAVSPGEAFPPADAMVLTANVWADGYLAAGGVQWFKFTATAATQYIHVTLLTLSSLYIQVYAGNGSMAGSQAHLSSNTLNVSRTLTIGQEYYIRVWPYSGSGQFRIGLNAWAGAIGEVFPPATFIPLSPGVWADVYLAVGGAQWFKFTATAAAQYISFKPGTLTGVNWQVYISSGNTVAESALGEYMLTHGQEYYIRVEPSGGGSGTYQIAFSDSRLLQPGEVFPPAAVSSLTANTWENGNIATGGEQWFRFTATAVTQYIHFKPGTLGGVYVQVYTSSGFSTGRQSNLYSSGARYTVETLAIGQEHYVRVWPYASNGSGAYQIGFTASVLLPDEAFPPASATVLSVGIWENGNIAAGGVQWFKFTATAATQYVHFKPGTLTAVYTQVYTSNGNDAESALGAYMVTVGQEYYIRVWWSSGSGAYQIGFTASALLPDEAFPPASATALSAGIWENGNIAAGGVQWFKFTATAATQYTHLQRGTPVRSARIHMFASDGTEARNQNDNFYSWITAHTLTVGQEYHIRVSSPNGSGAYQVAFNDRAVPPGEVFPPVNPAILSANVWEVGYLVHVWTAGISAAGGVQWFRFTATAATQYIHFKPGATLTSIYAYVLAADGTAAGSEVILWSGGLYSAQTLIIGQEYYVRVWPWTYDPSGSGYFQMAFNTSALPPP
ncbi:MAG: hypothetical protein LBC99_02565, partial [Spirochaetota bacterium]|nr:hypothetical protein [Spirochaetota bacterium]